MTALNAMWADRDGAEDLLQLGSAMATLRVLGADQSLILARPGDVEIADAEGRREEGVAGETTLLGSLLQREREPRNPGSWRIECDINGWRTRGSEPKYSVLQLYGRGLPRLGRQAAS